MEVFAVRKVPSWLRMLGCVVTLLFLVGLGWGQEITVRPQPPSPPGEFRLEPLLPRDRVRIPEQDYRPEPQLADHAPALIHPFTGTARVGAKQAIRFGASAWTAPHETAGISQVERNGGVVALGFTLSWGAQEEETSPASR